jgi:hypothetical protein
MVETNVPSKSSDAGHELTDLSPRKIALFAITLAATIFLVFLVAYALFGYFDNVWLKNQVALSPLSFIREPTPEPHLLVRPGNDLKAMRADEDLILNSYDWVDKEKGVARIPIDRAMEIIAQRGLPTRIPNRDTAAKENPNNQKKAVKNK